MYEPILKTTETAPTRAAELARQIMAESPLPPDGDRWQAVRSGRGPSPRTRIVAGCLAGVCLVLTLLNLTGRMPLRSAGGEPSGAALDAEARKIVEFGSRAVDAYLAQHGELPSTLAEVGAPDSSRWTYVPMGRHNYWIRYEVDGVVATYDSTERRVEVVGSSQGGHE